MERIMKHPSGIKDEAELAYVSMEFWTKYSEGLEKVPLITKYSHLLAFQQGWQASKEHNERSSIRTSEG